MNAMKTHAMGPRTLASTRRISSVAPRRPAARAVPNTVPQRPAPPAKSLSRPQSLESCPRPGDWMFSAALAAPECTSAQEYFSSSIFQAVDAAPAPSKTATFTFTVPEYVTKPGEFLKVVGSSPELGAWSFDLAPAMKWHEGHRWSLEIDLPKDGFEYKIVAFSAGHVRWEDGPNRKSRAAASAVSGVQMICQFGVTKQDDVELLLEPVQAKKTFDTTTVNFHTAHMQSRAMQRRRPDHPFEGAEEQAAMIIANLERSVRRSVQDLHNFDTLINKAVKGKDGSLRVKQQDFVALWSI